MITNNIQEESTPVFGDAPEADAPSEKKVLSWEEEKTLLVFEDDESSAAARLINSETGDAIDLDVFPFSIGRSATANLPIQHRSVSREHARISQQPGGPGFIIEDVASSNGIRINGIKTTKVILSNSDVVKFGDVEYTFEVEQNSASTVIESTSTDIVAKEVPKNATESKGLSAKFDLGQIKSRLPFLRGSGGAKSDTASAKSKYPLIAAGAAIVLLSAYFLSPARRVNIIEAPVASSEAESKSTSDETAASNEASAKTETPAVTDTTTRDSSVAKVEASSPSSTEEVVDISDTAEVKSVDDVAMRTADESVASAETVVADSLVSTNADPMVDSSSEDAGTPVSVASGSDRQVAVAGTDSASAVDAVSVAQEIDSVEVAKVVAEPKREVIRRSPEWSRAYIRNSLTMYTDGDVESAVRRLRILSRSGRHQPQFRQEAGSLADGIEGMYQQYQSGRAMFDAGSHDEAFLVWRSFLVEESNLLPGRESVYASNIKSEVVRLYTQQGNTAYADGRQHDAYLAWQKASSIAPGGEAAGALADLQKRAKQRFIDGYLQESVSLQTATALWRDVVNMVPPANEYHIKAKAKLRLYKNYGS